MKNRMRAAAALAGATLLPLSVAAQEATPAPAATPPPAVTASPTPAPTPMPVLMGPAYETLRALAGTLKTEAEHVLGVASAGPPMGRRMFVMNSRLFARRTASFSTHLDTYRTQPFDVVAEVTQMRARAGVMSARHGANPALAASKEDWVLILDVLDRMTKLLAGEKVTLPSPHPPRPIPSPDMTGDDAGPMRRMGPGAGLGARPGGAGALAAPSPAVSPAPAPSPTRRPSPSPSPKP